MKRFIALTSLLIIPLSGALAAPHGEDSRHGGPGFQGRNAEQFLAERFARADANKDGYVSKDEAQANAPRLGVMFDAVDANRDGVIAKEELTSFHERMRAAHEQERGTRRAAMFQRLDANGDGFLSKDEVSTVAPRLAERFDAIDADKDGRLSVAELEAAHPRHARRGRHAH